MARPLEVRATAINTHGRGHDPLPTLRAGGQAATTHAQFDGLLVVVGFGRRARGKKEGGLNIIASFCSCWACAKP